MTCFVIPFGRLVGSGSISVIMALGCSEAVFTGMDPPSDTAGRANSAGQAGEVEMGPGDEPDRLPAGGRRTSVIPSIGAGSGGANGAGRGGASGGGASTSGGADVDGAGAGGGAGASGMPGCVPIQDTWQAELGTEETPWLVEFGDPFVHTASERLVVSYDDVASRGKAFAGSYYVSADVTLEGYTVFTPYPKAWQVSLPSLRRDAAGTGIELGSTSYGMFESWQAKPEGFAGVTIPSTDEVRVTTYVKATSKQLAVKVETKGGEIYRSGWVGGFTWEDTDLGVFRYVGENNSSVYDGASDYIYVGALDGCENLDDPAVEAHYQD
jgi:hypothetical protein